MLEGLWSVEIGLKETGLLPNEWVENSLKISKKPLFSSGLWLVKVPKIVL